MQLIPATSFWEPPDEGEIPKRGVTETQLSAWEDRHKLTFPSQLHGPYRTQDGGMINHGDIPLLPLAEITWVDNELWAMIIVAEPALLDRTRAVTLCSEDERLFVLYYESSDQWMVYRFTFYTDAVADEPLTLEQFLHQQHHATPEPHFSWDETTQGNILFHERLPGVGDNPDDYAECVVIKTDQHVLIYQRSPDVQARTRFTLPLDVDGCWMLRHGWRGVRTYELTFSNDGDYVESNRCSDGLWKTEVTDDISLTSIESTNRARLDELFEAIAGPEGVRQLRRRQRRERWQTIILGSFMFFVVLPFILLFLVFSICMRILTWPIRLLFRRSAPPPSFPPGDGPVVIVKPE